MRGEEEKRGREGRGNRDGRGGKGEGRGRLERRGEDWRGEEGEGGRGGSHKRVHTHMQVSDNSGPITPHMQLVTITSMKVFRATQTFPGSKSAYLSTLIGWSALRNIAISLVHNIPYCGM